MHECGWFFWRLNTPMLGMWKVGRRRNVDQFMAERLAHSVSCREAGNGLSKWNFSHKETTETNNRVWYNKHHKASLESKSVYRNLNTQNHHAWWNPYYYHCKGQLHSFATFHLQQCSPLFAVHVATSFGDKVVSLISSVHYMCVFTQIPAIIPREMG